MLAAVNVSSPLTKGGRWSASPAALLIALVAALATLASPATGLARPGTHNFRLELNGAAMVADQSDRFDFGGGGGVAYGLGVLPFLEIQAGYRADFLRATSATSENGYGAFHGLGLALALHPIPDLDVGDLWIAVGGDAVFTGDVVRPGLQARIGFDFSVHWAVRVGPFVGFHYIFQTDQADLGPGDGAFLTFGISLAFGGEEEGGAETGPGDADGDGVPDGVDGCSTQPEDIDGFDDEDGCPDPDNDADGVPDAQDACPNRAPVGNTDEDGDGCPDEQTDSDGDGVPDATDTCPDAPEDIDEFQDLDGCPDADNDGDQIPDADDACPGEAETRNGFEDEDGCPDQAPEQAELTEIAERILFPRASDRPTRATAGVVAEMARFLNAHPDIEVVTIEGHASSTGDAEFNLRLSRQRAERVRRMLIARGVSGDRLVVEALGSSRATEDDDHAEDRRVTFTITRRAGE